MPDQPDDPIHYDMKIPPEPQNATLHKNDEHRDADEVTHESNDLEDKSPKSTGNSPQTPERSTR